MKNQFIRLWNFIIEYSKEYLLLKLLFICLIFRILYFYVLFPDMLLYNSDSVTYFIPVDIFSGKIDMYRTPVYPFIMLILAAFIELLFSSINKNKFIHFFDNSF
jgi:hypothetical protein